MCVLPICSLTSLTERLSVLSPSSEREQRFILLLITHSAYHDDYDCQDYKDRLRSANLYFFRAELNAEGTK